MAQPARRHIDVMAARAVVTREGGDIRLVHRPRGVIAEHHPHRTADGLASDGKGIDYAEDIHRPAIVAVIAQRSGRGCAPKPPVPGCGPDSATTRCGTRYPWPMPYRAAWQMPGRAAGSRAHRRRKDRALVQSGLWRAWRSATPGAGAVDLARRGPV